MHFHLNRPWRPWAALLLACTLAAPVLAQKRYDDGASDTEIRIGNIAPRTGLFSEFGGESRVQAAYFRMINDHGGINGRKVVFVSVDDGSDAGKSARLAQQLVEQDKVLLLFSTFGTQANLAIRDYANRVGVPQLFVQNSSSLFDDPTHYPWTMGLFATFRTEGRAYGRYILENRPGAKVGVLLANDESSREHLAGLREGLGARADAMIVREAVFRYSDPATIDAQVDTLRSTGADVFVNLASGRAVTQALKRAYDTDWHPLQFIPNGSLSAPLFLEPAGLEKAVGLISNARSKGWTGAVQRSDPAVAEFLAWLHDYLPDAPLRDALNVSGYERAQVLVEVLRRCGDDLTRANVMKQAASLDLALGMLRPGIRITTGPNDYQPIKDLYLVRFDGKDWVALRPTGGG